MKKLVFIAAVVFTTITLQSCRQSDDIFSAEEAATLQRAQDTSNSLLLKQNASSINTGEVNTTTSAVDGELVPPPRK